MARERLTTWLIPMREGWSVKSAGPVLGIAPTKVTQSIDPAFRKIAMLMLADPVATHIELLNAMEHVRREVLANGVRLDISRQPA